MLDNKLRILTWHIHGSYLYYLTQVNCEFYVPVRKDHSEGYIGLPLGNFPWGENVHEVDAEKVKEIEFDCILFQSKNNYMYDQYDILSPKQLSLPKIYLEHDPPRENPTNTRHIVDDPNCILVHVTNFNNIFWDNNQTPTVVIQHGVTEDESVQYTGELLRGIVVVNNIIKRGRRLGFDILETVKKHIPLDIIGMNSEEIGGLGEISHKDLPPFLAQYRFFFNPIRYTSLGLSVCEAMMVGLPIVGISATEMPEVIRNGQMGFLSNNLEILVQRMKELLHDGEYAKTLGKNAKRIAKKKFNIERFTRDWERIFRSVTTDYKRENIQNILQQIGGVL